MARINKVGHVVLAVRNPEASAKFYVEALGMELMRFMPEFQMAFLSFGTRDHDIALIKAPEDAPLGSQGLSHTALEIEGGEEELRQLYRRLLDHGARVEFTADHGLSKSLYFFDPDGNRLELFFPTMESDQALDFMRHGRAGLDPYALTPTPAS
jgi:catechol 2,3-dioxygenase